MALTVGCCRGALHNDSLVVDLPSLASRRVMVFHHIPKCGGSSIISTLLKSEILTVRYFNHQCFAFFFAPLLNDLKRSARERTAWSHVLSQARASNYCQRMLETLRRHPGAPLVFEIHDWPSMHFFEQFLAPHLPSLRARFRSSGGNLHIATQLRSPESLLPSMYRMWPPLVRPRLPPNRSDVILSTTDIPFNYSIKRDVHVVPLRTWLNPPKTGIKYASQLPDDPWAPYGFRGLPLTHSSTEHGVDLSPMSAHLFKRVVNAGTAEDASGLRKNANGTILRGCLRLDASRDAIATHLEDPCSFDFYCTLDRMNETLKLIGAALGRHIGANNQHNVPRPDIRYDWKNFRNRLLPELDRQYSMARSDPPTAKVLSTVAACETQFYERVAHSRRACSLPVTQCTGTR